MVSGVTLATCCIACGCRAPGGCQAAAFRNMYRLGQPQELTVSSDSARPYLTWYFCAVRRAAAKLPLNVDLEMLLDVKTRSPIFVPFMHGEADLPPASLPSDSKDALVIGANMLIVHRHTFVLVRIVHAWVTAGASWAPAACAASYFTSRCATFFLPSSAGAHPGAVCIQNEQEYHHCPISTPNFIREHARLGQPFTFCVSDITSHPHQYLRIGRHADRGVAGAAASPLGQGPEHAAARHG